MWELLFDAGKFIVTTAGSIGIFETIKKLFPGKHNPVPVQPGEIHRTFFQTFVQYVGIALAVYVGLRIILKKTSLKS